MVVAMLTVLQGCQVTKVVSRVMGSTEPSFLKCKIAQIPCT